MRKSCKKIISFMIATIILFTVAPITTSALSQNDVVSWMDSKNGTTIYDGGSQCVAAFNSYLRIWGISNPISKYPVNYAYQIFNYNAPDGWQKISGSGNYQVGDVVIWNSSVGRGAGHVGMVYSTSGGTVKIFDQNYVAKNVCGIHNIAQTSAIRGVFRPIYSNPILPDPQVENWFYHGATDHSDFRPVISVINPETVSSVKFAVRYDTGDWKWYDGEFNGSNAWFCDVLSSDLGIGNYIICHAYVYGKNGSNKGYPFTELTLGKDANPSVQTWYYDGATEHSDFRPVIRFDNPETVSAVKFAVRYDTGDWKWYDGMYNGGNAWYCDVLSDDLGSGDYILCHGYVYAKNGSYKGYPFVNLKLDKDYEDPSLNNWYYTIDSQKQEINFIMDFNNPETVSNVRFAIRTANTDWEWYDGTYNGDNAWDCTVQIDGYEEGEIIYCHCYVKGRNGFYDGYPYPEVEVKIKHKIGDVDGDGGIRVEDVTTLQKYLADIVDFDDEQSSVADTNGDGNIDIRDVTQIQQYLAKIITSLG